MPPCHFRYLYLYLCETKQGQKLRVNLPPNVNGPKNSEKVELYIGGNMNTNIVLQNNFVFLFIIIIWKQTVSFNSKKLFPRTYQWKF